MADLDTIMNDLELCTHPTPSACRKCTHKGTPDDCPHCFMRLAADALELIKEQKRTNVETFRLWCYERNFKFRMSDRLLAHINFWINTFEELTKPKEGKKNDRSGHDQMDSGQQGGGSAIPDPAARAER